MDGALAGCQGSRNVHIGSQLASLTRGNFGYGLDNEPDSPNDSPVLNVYLLLFAINK